MAKCFACGERKFMVGPANEAGKQVVRLTRNIESMLQDERLEGMNSLYTNQIVSKGNWYIEELEAVVHRQRSEFYFPAHAEWVREATFEDMALHWAIEGIRDGLTEPDAKPEEVLNTVKAGLWAELWVKTHADTGTDEATRRIESFRRDFGYWPWEMDGFMRDLNL